MTKPCERCSGTAWTTNCKCSNCFGTGWAGVVVPYAGIGARKTPEPVLAEMTTIGALLAIRGFGLRSGGAIGADKAFERGADSVGGRKVIRCKSAWQPALDHAEQYHPNWAACDEDARHLHARNSMIVMGDRFDCPAAFIVCWTEGGAVTGGTGQALRIAAAHNIPVFNLAVTPSAALWEWLGQ